MPILGALLKGLLGNIYALALALVGQQIATRLAGIATVAALYVAAVAAFMVFVTPMVGALFSTAYGQVIGLAFPPIAGSVVAGYVGLWGFLVLQAYYRRIVSIGAR